MYLRIVLIISLSLYSLISISQCSDSSACNFNDQINPCLYPGEMCDDGNDFSFNDIMLDDCSCQGIYYVTVDLFDMGANGWSGASLEIYDSSDELVDTFILENDSTSTEEVMLRGGCYSARTTADAISFEVNYTITTNDGIGNEDVFGIASDIQNFGVGVISGCMDPTAVNYEEEAQCDEGSCFYCENPEDCYLDAGVLKAAPCRGIEICGPGGFKILGSGISGILASGQCKTYFLNNPYSAYIQLNPSGAPMTINYCHPDGSNKTIGDDTDKPTCTKLDRQPDGSWIAYYYDWTSTHKKTLMVMNDPCGTGWDGINYEILNESHESVLEGTLSNSQYGDQLSNGYDWLDIEDGCYSIQFSADDCFYPCQEFTLIQGSQTLISGIVDGTPIPFTQDALECVYGCTDQAALNYYDLATAECSGDNSCCEYAPLNANCSDAEQIVLDSETTWETTYGQATTPFCDGTIINDVWFSYTADCNASMVLTVVQSQPVSVAVGLECEMASSSVFCETNISSAYRTITFDVTNGETYYFQMGAEFSNVNTFILSKTGCKGCMDSTALNFDSNASIQDDSCEYLNCPGDMNGDHNITSFDLSQFLGIFGTSCLPQE